MSTTNTVNYARGDWIVHCHYGVGQIEDVERKRIGNQENTYFRIRTSDSTIWIPVDQMDADQIRPIVDKTHFEDAVQVLNDSPREMASNLNKRKSRIKQVVVSNVPTKTARLIRDLRARRRSRSGLNQVERQALRDLTKRFVQEWAVCKGLTLDQARHRLNRRLRKRQAATESHSSTPLKDGGGRDKSSLLNTLIKKDHRWAKWLNQQLAKGKGI